MYVRACLRLCVCVCVCVCECVYVCVCECVCVCVCVCVRECVYVCTFVHVVKQNISMAVSGLSHLVFITTLSMFITPLSVLVSPPSVYVCACVRMCVCSNRTSPRQSQVCLTLCSSHLHPCSSHLDLCVHRTSNRAHHTLIRVLHTFTCVYHTFIRIHHTSPLNCQRRYELREDRKKETMRTTSHMDSLRRDIRQSFHHQACSQSVPSFSDLPYPPSYPYPPGPGPGTGQSGGYRSSPSHGLLSRSELEQLKKELVSELKNEVRAATRQLMAACVYGGHNGVVGGGGGGGGGGRGVDAVVGSHLGEMPAPQTVPQLRSELYHTHLYTQL